VQELKQEVNDLLARLGEPIRYVRQMQNLPLSASNPTPREHDRPIHSLLADSERTKNALLNLLEDQKRVEEALRASGERLHQALQEKTTLLKEVHHRVKNNLQLVTSLLNLQATRLRHPEVQALLHDTQSRVRSMALLHESLYSSENLARIGFASYIETLCGHLIRSTGADASRVKLVYQVTEVELGLEHAVPCGLIINELVSNALKHAFPAGRSGQVTLEIGQDADHQIALAVADDGIGLPADTPSTQPKTLGLELVTVLTRQLRGQLTVDRTPPGTRFRLVFATETPKA